MSKTTAARGDAGQDREEAEAVEAKATLARPGHCGRPAPSGGGVSQGLPPAALPHSPLRHLYAPSLCPGTPVWEAPGSGLLSLQPLYSAKVPLMGREGQDDRAA